MIIQSVHIVHFGKLSELSLSFHKTLHIIEGENEAGKSTLAAFIRFMLYGLDPADTAFCQKAISRQSGTAEGSMIVEVKEGIFRLVRKAEKKGPPSEPPTQTSAIYNEVTGEEITDAQSAGLKWFGFPAAIYKRIACIGQLAETKVDDTSMRQSIENLLFSGDEKINIRHATALLSARRDKLQTVDGKGGEIPRLKAEAEDTRRRLDRVLNVNRQVLVTQAKLEGTRQKLRTAEQALQDLVDRDDKSRNLQLSEAFDHLHAARAQSRDISDRLVEMKKGVGHMGFIPDREYLTELGVNRRLYTDSLEAEKQAREDLARIETAEVIDADVQRYVRQTSHWGGEEKLQAEVRDRHAKTMLLGSACVLCLAFFVVCAVFAGLALPGYLAGDASLLGRLTACGILGVVFTAAAVTCFLLARASRAKETALYLPFGAHEYRDMVTRINRIVEYRNRAAESLMRVRAAQKYCEKTEEASAGAYEVLAATLRRWDGEAPPRDGDVLGYTDKLIEATANYLDTLRTLSEEKSRLDATVAQLREQLRGQNEDAIRKKMGEKAEVEVGQMTPDQISGGIAAYRHQCVLLRKSEEMLSSQYAVQKEQMEDPTQLAERLAELTRRLRNATDEFHALELALSTFLDVDDRLKARIVPRLAESSRSLIQTMTGGTYRDIDLGDDLSLRLKLGNEAFTTDMVSAGTRDIAYLALKLSIIFLLCREELPPVCMDECFAFQDDTRSLNMMKMLKAQSEKGMQTLIFTCRAREEILAHQTFGAHHVGYTHLASADE